MEKREIVHIAKIGEKREKTFNFSPFCGIINYIRNKTNLIQMLDFTVFVHISKCIKIVQVKRRIPVLFWIVLATMMLPGQLGIIGYFQEMNGLGLLDSYLSIIMPSFATPVMVYWIRQYIDAYVPNELMESARIDGCNEFKIFNKIIFPVIIPGVATQAIFTFVGCWNSFVQPSILLFSQEKFTLPILVQQMQGVYKTDYGVIYLGVTLSVIPILLLFMFCSKKILESSMAGAVKG